MADVVVGTRKMVFLAGDNTSPPLVAYTDEVSGVRVVAAESDSDFMSYTEADAGGARMYTLKLTLRQNVDVDSLWYLVWNSLGSDLDVELWPAGKPGDSIPTTSQPKVTGTVTIVDPDGTLLGGDAKMSNTTVQVAEVEWQFTAKPTIATSA